MLDWQVYLNGLVVLYGSFIVQSVICSDTDVSLSGWSQRLSVSCRSNRFVS